MSVFAIDKHNFDQEVLASEQPVLIDFWAPWCGPCRMMAPVVDEVAAQHTEVKVGKINIDEEPELAQRYGVMSIPTLVLFRNGEAANRSVGLKPKAEVEAMLR